MIFKKDDWCFFEFELNQVVETEGNEVTCVTDSAIRCSGRFLSDRCYELTLRNKSINDEFKYWSKELHKLSGLNFPDIHRELVDRWAATCDTSNEKDLDHKIKSLGEFCKAIIRASKDTQVEGVKIFR